jgi:hypothetical protein
MDGKSPITAAATNISAGGMQFFLPKGSMQIAQEELVELVFNLPEQGATLIKGEICYFSQALDSARNPIACYGIKFFDLSLDTQNQINEYCQSRLEKTEAPITEKRTPKRPPKKETSPSERTPYQSLSQDVVDNIIKNIQQDIAPDHSSDSAASQDIPAQANAEQTTVSPAVTAAAEPTAEPVAKNILDLISTLNSQPVRIQTYKTDFARTPAKLPQETGESLMDITLNIHKSIPVAPNETTIADKEPGPTPVVTEQAPDVESSSPSIPTNESIAKQTGENEVPVQPKPTHQERESMEQLFPDSQTAFSSTKAGSNLASMAKSSSLISMDQQMIDRLLYTMNPAASAARTTAVSKNPPLAVAKATAPDPPNPAPPSYASAPNHTANFNVKLISVSLKLKNGKMVQGLLESINFGGLLARVSEEIPVNSMVQITLWYNELTFANLTGVCICNDPAPGTNRQILTGIYFENLPSEDLEKLRSLLARLRIT